MWVHQGKGCVFRFPGVSSSVWNNSQPSPVDNLGTSCLGAKNKGRTCLPTPVSPTVGLGASKGSVARKLPTPATGPLSHQNRDAPDSLSSPPPTPAHCSPPLPPGRRLWVSVRPADSHLPALIVTISTKPFPCI